MSKPTIHKDNVTGSAIKSMDDTTGIIQGYASVYGVQDSDGEFVDKNCFQRSLAHNGGKVPILFGHDRNQVAGWAHSGVEDQKGLYVTGKLSLETEVGKKAYYFLKGAMEAGANNYATLSIGFVPDRNGIYKDDSGNVHYRSAALREWSVVPFASNPEATITSVKQCKEYTESEPELLSPSPGESPMLLPSITVEQALKAAKGEDAGLSDEQKQSFEAMKTLLAAMVKQDLTPPSQTEQKGIGLASPNINQEQGATAPITFEAALTLANQQDALQEDRWNLERALCDAIMSIKQSDQDLSEKKMLILQAYYAYGKAMTEWQAQMMSAEQQVLGATKAIKGMNTSTHVEMQGKRAQAAVHRSEAKASALKAHMHLEKADKLMGEVMNTYATTDVNVPNPQGKKAEAIENPTPSVQEPVDKSQDASQEDWSCVLKALEDFDDDLEK